VGEHWVNSALAALLTSLSCGVRFAEAARALGTVEPFVARMQPVLLPSGATILRDELSGDPESLEAALRVMKECNVARRVVAFGDLSDAGSKKPRDRFKTLGKAASQVAEVAVFVGAHAPHALKAAVASGMRPDRVFGFTNLRAAAEFLKTELRSGDLVLLRGRTTEHFSRLFFAQFGPIGCWKIDCRKTISCDFCEELRPDFAAAAMEQRPRQSEPLRSRFEVGDGRDFAQ
jgi:UDP-N-acetylmuramoyl-tripeptide--D-alanyl-D-alanine ligase